VDVRIEVLLDHLQGSLELYEAAHREVLALDRHDHLVGGGERIDGQQAEARRRVDADVVVVAVDLAEGLLERALAADLGAHGDLGAGQVDRGDGDVDLAMCDYLGDRQVVDEHVVHALLDLVRVDALAHGQVALRVEVDAEHAVAQLRQCHRQVEGRGRLGDAALLVGEADDVGEVGLRLGLHFRRLAVLDVVARRTEKVGGLETDLGLLGSGLLFDLGKFFFDRHHGLGGLHLGRSCRCRAGGSHGRLRGDLLRLFGRSRVRGLVSDLVPAAFV